MDVNYGFGQMSMTLPKGNLPKALQACLQHRILAIPADQEVQLFWISQIVYKVTITATKISILLLYLRIFPHQKFRYATFVVMAFVFSYATASILATVFQCLPVSRVWDKSVSGHCINLTAFWYANAGSSIFSDLMIFVLPIPVIHSLHLPFRQKVALVMVFAIATFVCVTSVLRMTTLNVASKSNDQTYGTLISTTWTTIELNTGIICACMPMLRGPLSWLFPRLFMSMSANDSTGSSGHSRRFRRRTRSAHSTGTYTSRRNTAATFRDPFQAHISTHGPTYAGWVHGQVGAGCSPPPPYLQRDVSTTSHESQDPIILPRVGDERTIPMGIISKTTDVEVRFDDGRGCD
ncbi:hypothetical protein MMC13_005930 [Lambiella insularis]|nr:hypothetical protein [Lambiella insularis]